MPSFEHSSFFFCMSHVAVLVNAEFHGHTFWGATWQLVLIFALKSRASNACIFINVCVHAYICMHTYKNGCCKNIKDIRRLNQNCN